MANAWSQAEIEATVADYFEMLRLELQGRPVNKTAHRQDLKRQLPNRNESAIEFKHPNISAVLIEMGLPYIAGYKPRFNYQHALVAAVETYLDNRSEFAQLFDQSARQIPSEPIAEQTGDIWETPPESRVRQVADDSPVHSPIRRDYVAEEARNQKLGEAGERFILELERTRLRRAGKDTLAERIEQVSATQGPSAGFDIKSYEEDGSDRLIEAKTTKYGKYTPFFITPNELRFSHDRAASYRVYRLFEFGPSPGIFQLCGAVEQHCALDPTEFMARLT